MSRQQAIELAERYFDGGGAIRFRSNAGDTYASGFA